MATKYVLVTLFILILLPSSLPTPLSGKFTIPRGRFGNIGEVFKDPRQLYKRIPKKLRRKNHQTGQPAGNITYDYVFTFNMTIGTPPVAYNGIWDMSIDLSWTNCDPSDQIYPIYNSSKSSTSSMVPCTDPFCQSEWKSTCPNNCSVTLAYDDQDFTQVTLARDNFTLGDLPLPDIVFGCGTQNEGIFRNISGIIGFGWGNLSLVSQMGYENFSYCVSSDISDGSYIFFGSAPNLMGNTVQQTPLIQNPSFTSAYYVNLLGISVGDEPLKIPKTTFSLLPDGSGGVILDSGTLLTYLEREGYNQVKNALLNKVRLPPKDGKDIGLDLCFLFSDLNELLTMPTITLQFDGAYMVLDYSNYMLIDETDSFLCLAMLPSDDISIFGYLLQSGKHIFIDIKNPMVSFQIEDCGKL